MASGVSPLNASPATVAMRLNADALLNFRLSSPSIDFPPEIFLIKNFISRDRSESLTAKINSVPKPKWKSLSNRRLQQWGGVPSTKGMLREALPGFIDQLCEELEHLEIFRDYVTPTPPSACSLEQESLGGGVGSVEGTTHNPQGILPHLDGPLYLPCVATVSIGSHCLLDFYPSPSSSGDPSTTSLTKPSPKFSLFVPPDSLYVQTGPIYHTFMHAVAERVVDVVRVGGWDEQGSTVNDVQVMGPEEDGRGNCVVDGRTVINLDDLISYASSMSSSSSSAIVTPNFIHLPRTTRLSLTFRVVRKASKWVIG
ncbi:Alpha-ketoglutarate-dependent dioxygenase alkB 6 [Gonapodya sp. JEL0774]|nr:Alpha-ketoglutarate-dependent dioxygenase alkB 6 [Gonapodya sp. JEL0774]